MNYKKISSPAYVLDEKLLRKNLELISQVQKQADIEIILAFKGFAMWSAFPLVRQYIKGATASSLYEARLCFEEMKTRAHVYAPAYMPNEFDELMQYTSHIVFNSLNQFNTFYPETLKADHKISCGLRINPEQSDVSTDLYNPSSPKSRLGILRELLPKQLPKGIEGLHFHVLCESTSYALEEVLVALEEKFGEQLKQIQWINMGGGHLMTRKDYDTKHLVEVLKRFKAKHNIHILLEPGSAFAWQTGILVAQVLDLVENRGLKTAILNVSFTAHMPDTLEMPYRPKIAGAKEPNEQSKHLYRLGGMSCLAGDYMEVYDFEKELNVGDTIIFEDMIHYTMVKTTMFNGVNHPDIGIWKENDQYEVVRKFTYEDYKNRLS